jgi:hypothetical protein
MRHMRTARSFRQIAIAAGHRARFAIDRLYAPLTGDRIKAKRPEYFESIRKYIRYMEPLQS